MSTPIIITSPVNINTSVTQPIQSLLVQLPNITPINPLSSQSADIVSAIVAQLATNATQGTISKENIIEYMYMAMTLIEKYNDLTGQSKQDIVVSVLDQLVNNTNLQPLDKFMLNDMIKNTVPSTIALICATSKGISKINIAIEKKLNTCCL